MLLYCLNTIYGKGKKGNSEKEQQELGTEQLDAQHSALATLNCMYVCILLLVTLKLLLWTILYEL